MAGAKLTLDLRSYSGETQVHHHDYHQLVLPVSGKLSMQIDGRDGEVSADGLALVPVQQVAEQVGYASLAAFSDRFRRHFGHSPRHFRRNSE